VGSVDFFVLCWFHALLLAVMRFSRGVQVHFTLTS
jgi:hypothetical protein